MMFWTGNCMKSFHQQPITLLRLAHHVTKVPKTTVNLQDNDVVDWELQILVEPLPNQLVGDQRSFHQRKTHKVQMNWHPPTYWCLHCQAFEDEHIYKSRQFILLVCILNTNIHLVLPATIALGALVFLVMPTNNSGFHLCLHGCFFAAFVSFHLIISYHFGPMLCFSQQTERLLSSVTRT